MNVSRDMLEDQLQNDETQLKSLKSYLKELNDMTAKHGTDRAQFEQDLLEVENNIKYYGGEVARVKNELQSLEKTKGVVASTAATMLPQTVKQGVGSLILSTISFGVGALLGSKLKSKRGDKDSKGKSGDE
jgi:septal ring factor EnvC (AmiA/AmiB activator)